MRLLVVGGAGYIGSHMAKLLWKRKCEVTVFDNLSAGSQNSVLFGKFIRGDLSDRQLLRSVLRDNQYDAVMHFASHIQVGESCKKPLKYYQNNFVNSLILLEEMISAGVLRLVFSSSAAVFGNPIELQVDELHPLKPINPYGRSKLMVEEALADFDIAYGLKSVSLRYFNAAGADPDGQLGERHEPETHLIPLALQVASGHRSHVSVYGDDYDTPDGSCIRDFVHVCDICEAHWLALNFLSTATVSQRLNLGNGSGLSVFAVIDAVCRVTGIDIPTVVESRRPGDPPRLVANSAMAERVLGWIPQFREIDTIIAHAWNWERNELNTDRSAKSR